MPEAKKVIIPIGGMTCQHCVDSVTKALSKQSGVTGVEVSLAKGEARVTGTGLNLPALRSVVEDLGFDAGEAVG